MAFKTIKLRQWLRAIHRDLGYFCFGLTIIYAISGVAVNHVDDWNPTYNIKHFTKTFPPIKIEGKLTHTDVVEILDRLNQSPEFKNYFQSGPETVDIFVGSNTLSVNFAEGVAKFEIVKKRPVLYEMNFLHLNRAKKLWTYFADLYAVFLFILAISGIFILKGRKGLAGRGAWFTSIGIIVPIIFLLMYA